MLVFRILFFFLTCLFLSNYSFSQLECKNLEEFYKTHPQNSILKRAGSNPLMENYDVKYYNIDLNVSNTTLAIKGFVQMKAQVKTDGFNKVVLNLANTFTIDSVYLNGKKVTYSKNGDELTINATTALVKNEYFESKVYYKGNGASGADFPAGMNMGTYGNNSYLYTVSEPYHSYLWWPCKQDLLDKADSAAVNITTKSTNLVAANGILTKTTTIGSDKRFEWKTKYPIAYYLLTFSAGPYVEYKTYANPSGFSKPILIQAFVYDQTYLNNNKSVIDQTAILIEKFSEKFGLYPFAEEKYGYYTAPFQFGALENQTMTMMNGFDFDLVAHELAHQWFGNNVTCTDWSQIWLHEGMADFCESIANELIYGENNRQSSISSSQSNVLAQPTNCATIKNTNVPMNIFNKANAYSKGATVMNMLRFEIGDDKIFFDMLKEYQKKYAFKNANTDTLSRFIKTYTGKDYSTFFNQWIVGTGFPNYTFSSYQRGDTVYVSSKQTTTSSLTPFYEMKLDFNLVSSTGTIIYVTDYQKKANETFKFIVKNQRISSLKPNPKVWSLYKNNSASSINVLSGDNFITAFSFNGAVSSKITETNIDVLIPYGTDLKTLKAIFTFSTGATVKIGSITQASGTTVNNFTGPVIYTVVAANGMTKNYIVNVTIAKNTEKQITSFSFDSLNPIVNATISGTIITATVPFRTDITKLVASFTISEKATVNVGQTQQVSSQTVNDFTNPVFYSVTAEDGSTIIYSVIVSIAKNTEKQIISFSFDGLNPIVNATITGTNITATVPFGTDITKLVANFTTSEKATVNVGQTQQVSSQTVNDFTNPLTYTVTAEDGSTFIYSVIVSIAKNTEKQITTFSFNGFNPLVTATITGTNITATVPFGTDLTKLVATFTASAKAIVTVGQTQQVSGTTSNDFTKSVTYTVTAEDGIAQNYVVNISVETNKKAGISILTKNNVIYPNPNNGEFFINAQPGDLKIEIKDLEGRMVYCKSISYYQGEKIIVDIKGYTSSMFIVHILNNDTETFSQIEVLK